MGTQLVGILHESRFFDDVKEYLRQLKGKSVGLEIPAYPLPEFYQDVTPEGNPFYGPLAEHVLSQGGILVPMEDKRLYLNAVGRVKKLKKKQHAAYEKGNFILYNEYEKAINYLACIERTPHFRGVIEREKPDYAVLGCFHVQKLAKMLQTKPFYIPPDAEYAGPDLIRIAS